MSIVLLVLVSSIVYTKAYRIKNRIVDIIEINKGYNDTARDQIDTALRQIGYRANTNSINNCPLYNGNSAINTSSLYHYCIYENTSDKSGKYYTISAFAYFDLPLISSFEIPVYGETKIIYVN